MKLSEAIRELIRLGDASQAYWDRELPKHHPHYPVILPSERVPAAPPEDSQIEAILSGLPEDQLYAVALLMYVGRGDFTVDRLIPGYQMVKESLPSKETAVAQIVEQKTLGEYLSDAMLELQKRQLDVDKLVFPSFVAAT